MMSKAEISSIDLTEHIHHSEDPALYMKRSVADIYKAITEGTSTRIDADEAYRGMQIMMGIYESAEKQQTIRFK